MKALRRPSHPTNSQTPLPMTKRSLSIAAMVLRSVALAACAAPRKRDNWLSQSGDWGLSFDPSALLSYPPAPTLAKNKLRRSFFGDPSVGSVHLGFCTTPEGPLGKAAWSSFALGDDGLKKPRHGDVSMASGPLPPKTSTALRSGRAEALTGLRTHKKHSTSNAPPLPGCINRRRLSSSWTVSIHPEMAVTNQN